MSSKSKNLRAFASSRETKKEEATPALVPVLGRCPRLVYYAPLERFSSAPRGRNIPAQGIALGQPSPTFPSPEGATHLLHA